MKKTGRIAAVLAALALLGLRAPLRADEVISASVDRNRVALNESLQLNVTLSGSGNLPDPQTPDLSAFSSYSAGRSQNISIVNGHMASSVTRTYILTPKSPGHFTIGSFSVTVDGRTHRTDPIPIEVTAAQSQTPAAPQAQSPSARRAPGAFVTMTADKSRAFVNEQVVLTFRFHYRIPLAANPEYQPPSFAGFLYEDLPPPRSFTESVHGAQYNVSEVRYALFPTRPGRVVIPPATLKISVQDLASNPFSDDFFGQFFGGGAKSYLLKTRPVELTALPLPEKDRPEHFSGGVGEFKISASVDRARTAVGEPVTLTCTIQGAGDIKSLGDPQFPPFSGFRKYDTASSLNIDKNGGTVRGSKVYTVVLVPQVLGSQRIPPISFSYFHLPSRAYRTISTAPIPLQVAPGKPGGAGAIVLTPSGAAPQGIRTLNRDIHYIKTRLPHRDFEWLYKKRLFLVLNLVPLLFLSGAGAYRGRIALRDRNPRRRRFLNAWPEARKRLDRAGKEEDPERAANRIFEAVQGYLADKMLVSPAGLTLKSAEDFFAGRGAPAPLLRELRGLWNELELAHYAPAQFRAVDRDRLRENAARILKELDRSLPSGAAGTKVLLLLLGLGLCAAAVSAQTAPDLWTQANADYQAGRFDDALKNYEQLRAAGRETPELEYDLGNACYRTDRLGEALAHWIRAWRMAPRDSDVRYNLSLASARSGEPFFPGPPLRWAEGLYDALNLNELAVLYLAALWISCGLLGTSLLRRGSWRSLRNGVAAAALLAFGAWFFFRCAGQEGRAEAVVSVAKAEVRSGPGTDFSVGFTLPEGRRVDILDESGGWLEVGVSKEGLKGWVESTGLVRI